MKIPHSWTFENKEVAKNFDNHVREQLPWYDLATSTIRHLVRHYAPNDGLVYDLGASTGNIGNQIKDVLKHRNCKLVAIEKSKEMSELYQCDYGDLIIQDITDYQFKKHDISILFLTMMFISPKDRSKLLSNIYDNLNEGGLLIIFDKQENHGGYIGLVDYRLTLEAKTHSTDNYKDLIEKELSLAGVQIPMKFKTIEKYNPYLFFKFSDFVGYMIEK